MEWEDIFREEETLSYYGRIKETLKTTRKEFYPAKENIFRAFQLTPFNKVKVVILGQDPYPGGSANGLAFGVDKNKPLPDSLQNIFQEINLEYKKVPEDQTLTSWAVQGVLLMNSALTVEKHSPASHAEIGWQCLTDRIICELARHGDRKVFMLWGTFAKEKKKYTQADRNLVLEAYHPSPLSVYRGFYGCNHFVRANDFLQTNNQIPIDWISSI